MKLQVIEHEILFGELYWYRTLIASHGNLDWSSKYFASMHPAPPWGAAAKLALRVPFTICPLVFSITGS